MTIEDGLKIMSRGSRSTRCPDDPRVVPKELEGVQWSRRKSGPVRRAIRQDFEVSVGSADGRQD